MEEKQFKELKEKLGTIDGDIEELKEAVQTRNFHLKVKPLHYVVTGLVAAFIFSSVVTYALQNIKEHLPSALLAAGVALGFFYIVFMSICESDENRGEKCLNY